MAHDDFIDFKQVCQYYGNNFFTTSNSEQIKIGDIKVVKVDKDSSNTIFVKTSYQQEEFKNIIVGRKRSRTTLSFDIQNAYSKKLKIPDRKKDDINANHIPKSYKGFYTSVFEA